MGEDRLLELAQLAAGFEAQLAGEPVAQVAERRERVGVPAGAVEREHLLPAQPLAQRVLGDERLQLPRDVGVAAEREVGLDALLQRQDPQLLEAPDLRLREGLVAEVGEHRSAPQREHLAQQRRRLVRAAGAEQLPRGLVALGEASASSSPGSTTSR